MATFKYLQIAEYDAHGGPEIENKIIKATPTRVGRYVIDTIAKHVSYDVRYKFFSGIEWGTPLRESQGKAQIKQNNIWINLTSTQILKEYEGLEINEKLILEELYKEYVSYKKSLGNKGLLTDREMKAKLPDKWIYNDFGHLAIKYFADLDGNYIRNRNETNLTDYVHTTPYEEFHNAHHKDFDLDVSHGCIHIRSQDMDTFIKRGYAKKGNVIEIHSYIEKFADISMERSVGRPPYEIHFYPGMQRKSRTGTGYLRGKIIIYNVTKIN